MPSDAKIAAPVAKAASALAAGAGTSAGAVVARSAEVANFWPVDFATWLACLASGAAFIYSITLLCEWWWKRFLKPMAIRRGWVKAKAHGD